MKTIKIFLILLLTALPLMQASAAGGTLYITPASGVYRVDEPFTVEVFANSGGQKINAAEAEIAYNPSDFSIDSISTEGSILSTWSTSPSYDGAAGLIKFSGWASPSFTGKAGLLVTVTLRPKRVTPSTLSFNSGAMLAADERGSNILTAMTAGSYAVSPKQIVPEVPVIEASSSTVTDSAPVVSPESAGNSINTDSAASQLSASAAESSGGLAALVASSVELMPIILIFFALLVFFAFCIAYILHVRQHRGL